jgi:hypothetical protein
MRFTKDNRELREKYPCFLRYSFFFLLVSLIRIEGFIPKSPLARGRDLRSELCRGYKGMKPEYKYLMRTTTSGLCPAVVDYGITALNIGPKGPMPVPGSAITGNGDFAIES